MKSESIKSKRKESSFITITKITGFVSKIIPFSQDKILINILDIHLVSRT